VKNVPIAVYPLNAESLASMPSIIFEGMGELDKATYPSKDAFLKSNCGGAMALQIAHGKLDAYPIPPDQYVANYNAVSLEEMQTKNPKSAAALSEIFSDLSDVLGVCGAFKTVPTEMVLASDLGFPVENLLKIDAPWGGDQTKDAGKEAYLVVCDAPYLINLDESGLPVAYILASDAQKVAMDQVNHNEECSDMGADTADVSVELEMDVGMQAIRELLQHTDKHVRSAAIAAVVAAKKRLALACMTPSVTTEGSTLEEDASSQGSSSSNAAADEWYAKPRADIGAEFVALEPEAIGDDGDACIVETTQSTGIENATQEVEIVIDHLLEDLEVEEPKATAHVSTADLILGIEAREDVNACGDVTVQLSETVAICGATHAYCIGRILIAPQSKQAVEVPALVTVTVVNDGEVAWPKSAAVTLVSGPAYDFQHMELAGIQVGETVEVVLDLSISAIAAGFSRTVWAIVDNATGACLGPILCLEVMQE
jgi:hypothetical protein